MHEGVGGVPVVVSPVKLPIGAGVLGDRRLGVGEESGVVVDVGGRCGEEIARLVQCWDFVDEGELV